MKKANKIALFFHSMFWILTFLNHILLRGYRIEVALFEQIPIMAFFYWNYFKLIPYFFKDRKSGHYALWVLQFFIIFIIHYGTLGIFFWSSYQDIPIKRIFYCYGIGFYVAFQYATLCLACRLSYDYFMNLKKTADLEQQKRKHHLAALKSFINIPFMLSSLRLAEKQAVLSPEKTQSTILKLSNVLKHNLYHHKNGAPEVVHDFITLLCEHNSLDYELTQNNSCFVISFKNNQNTSLFISALEKYVNLPLPHYASILGTSLTINISKFSHHD